MTAMPINNEPLVVQEDHEAAAALLDKIGGIQRFEKFGISFAAMNNAFCGALARHRIKATSEAIERAAEVADELSDCSPRYIATAIRSLNDGELR